MKKCPTCSKTYEDNLKFCQIDGTPLVNDEPEDPYKTMVANKADLPIPPEKPKEEAKAPEPTPAPPAPTPEPKVETPVVERGAEPKPVVADKPEPKPEPPVEEELDPMKTMMITGNTRDNVKVDIPEEEPKKEEAKKEEPKPETPKATPPAPAPELEIKDEPAPKKIATPPAPELPKFDSPEVAPPPVLESTKLDEKMKEELVSDSLPTPPAKPPTADLPKGEVSSKPKEDKPSKPKREVKEKPSVPIPSPFDKSMPPGYAPPSTPPFDPTEPVKAERVGSAKASSGTDDSGSSSAPLEKADDNKFGSNNISENAGAEGQNKTLAIISLVCGVLSMTLCCGSVGLLLGPAGAIMGFMARGKANDEPNEYGGAGLALGGLITGIIGFLVSIIALVAYFTLNLAQFA